MHDKCMYIAQESCQVENKLFIDISGDMVNTTFIFANVQSLTRSIIFRTKNGKKKFHNV